MKNPQQDYTRHTWLATVAVIAVLVIVSFIPPQEVLGIKLRRANILSELVSFDDAVRADAAAAESGLFDEEDFRIDMEAVAERLSADTLPREVTRSYEWRLFHDTLPVRKMVPDSTRRIAAPTVAIEDFSDSGDFAAFCDTLLTARRPVRIAFLGDSFVEGDILTADLREALQQHYGQRPGGGAGFAPMASPLTGFRRTIKTQSKGWTSYNIMQRKSAPERLRNNFYVSGWVCQPTTGASTRWELTDYRRQLDSCTAARVFFIAPETSRIELTLNDTLRHEFTVEGAEAVREAVVRAPHVHTLGFKVLTGAGSFIGYGAIFEGRGVVVDNYSIRSNNGQAMFWTNPTVNAQIHALASYDLVILQYGLNIMQAGVTDYTAYARQIEKMVSYVRQCFPGAAVLVLGVSDRSVKGDGGFEPMDAVPAMTGYQRRAARRSGAAFWPVSEAMRAQGGMSEFVQRGWAGKDFTHINYGGGQRVAWALADALNAEVRKAYARLQAEEIRRQAAAAVVDTLQATRIRRELLPTLDTLRPAPQPLHPLNTLPHP